MLALLSELCEPQKAAALKGLFAIKLNLVGGLDHLYILLKQLLSFAPGD